MQNKYAYRVNDQSSFLRSTITVLSSKRCKNAKRRRLYTCKKGSRIFIFLCFVVWYSYRFLYSVTSNMQNLFPKCYDLISSPISFIFHIFRIQRRKHLKLNICINIFIKFTAQPVILRPPWDWLYNNLSLIKRLKYCWYDV